MHTDKASLSLQSVQVKVIARHCEGNAQGINPFAFTPAMSAQPEGSFRSYGVLGEVKTTSEYDEREQASAHCTEKVTTRIKEMRQTDGFMEDNSTEEDERSRQDLQ